MYLHHCIRNHTVDGIWHYLQHFSRFGHVSVPTTRGYKNLTLQDSVAEPFIGKPGRAGGGGGGPTPEENLQVPSSQVDRALGLKRMQTCERSTHPTDWSHFDIFWSLWIHIRKSFAKMRIS